MLLYSFNIDHYFDLLEGGIYLTFLHWATISPFLLAILIPFLYKYVRKIHTGWFVLLLPLTLFIYFLFYLPLTTAGEVVMRSEEHTSELQSRGHLVCRLLLEKKKKID